jgi:hypothetical protein
MSPGLLRFLRAAQRDGTQDPYGFIRILIREGREDNTVPIWNEEDR